MDRMMLHRGRIRHSATRFFEPEAAAWRGETNLATVFWGYGVFGSSALIALHATALMLRQVVLQEAMILASALYTVWIVVAIWRCSARAHPYWATLARWLTVAWALNSGLVLAFLQVELIVRAVGR